MKRFVFDPTDDDDEDIFIPDTTNNTSESYLQVNDQVLGNITLYSDERVNAYNRLLQLRTYIANINTHLLHLNNRISNLDQVIHNQIIASIREEIDSLLYLRDKAYRELHDIEYRVFHIL